MLRETIKRLKQRSEHLNYGRALIAGFAQQAARAWSPTRTIQVLDIGFGGGDDLFNVRQALAPHPVELLGLDHYLPTVMHAAHTGISAQTCNIEQDRFPLDAQSIDLVIANQIIEHTKQIFWVFSEISRVLRPGGALIVGVPNLASLHNRILLAVGEQPSTIELLGPHVRGITKNAFIRFITTDGYFRWVALKGSNFYPFPAALAQPLSQVFPTLAVSLFFLCERTHKPGEFIRALDTRFYETDYYTGPDTSAAPR